MDNCNQTQKKGQITKLCGHVCAVISLARYLLWIGPWDRADSGCKWCAIHGAISSSNPFFVNPPLSVLNEWCFRLFYRFCVCGSLQTNLYSGSVTFMPTYELLLCHSTGFPSTPSVSFNPSLSPAVPLPLLCLPVFFHSRPYVAPASNSTDLLLCLSTSPAPCVSIFISPSFIFVLALPICRSSRRIPAHHHSPTLHEFAAHELPLLCD